VNADFPVVLDTCVLVPPALCDTLLRLAERRLYLPRLSRQTIVGLEHELVEKIGLTQEKAQKRTQAIKEHFRDAIVSASEVLIPAMTNDEKNRHVAAAAVRAGAEVIVTLNLKDFPASALLPLRVEARHPDRFLIELFDLSPEVIIHSLHEQAEESDRSLEDLLQILVRIVPDFVILVTGHLDI
jgi:predicted nucleic acid-binding protein